MFYQKINNEEKERYLELAGSYEVYEKLRKENISCTIIYGKPSKALEYANAKKINYVIFVGENEIKSGKFKLKDMKSGKENMISEKDLLKKIY